MPEIHPLPLKGQHPPQSQVSVLEEAKSCALKLLIVDPGPALRESIFWKGGQMLNKLEKSYKAEEPGAIKLFTRGLNVVVGARAGLHEEKQSLSTLSSIVTSKLGVLSL